MKFRVLFSALGILLIVIIQTTLIDYIKVYNIKPNLIFIFIVCIALLRGNIEGAATGFFAGLLNDIVCGKMLGFYALLGLYLGLIIGSVNKRMYRENILVVVFFTFISSIVYESIVFFLGVFLKGQWALVYPFKGIILAEAVYNCVVSIFIYLFAIKIDNWVERANKASKRY